MTTQESGAAHELRSRALHEIRGYLKTKAPDRSTQIDSLSGAEVIWGVVDSLHILGLVTHLEKTFGFQVRPHEFTPENLAHLDALLSFVERKVTAPVA